MDAQKSKILGDLYYDTAPRQFVPPPIAERKALNKEKENDYLLTQNTKNELDKALRTMPRLPQSSNIYNDLKRRTEETLASINADNYSDKTLDTQQFANDFQNKYGGQQLVDEAKQMSEVQKSYDAAFEEGKIVDPAMVSWYKDRVTKGHKGLTVDENGYISQPNVSPVPYADYVDMQALLDEKIKGWESDGTIQRGADGRIKLERSIPGYLAYGENTFISEEELLKSGMHYLKNDAKTQAYLSDKVDFDTRNIQADAEGLNEVLTPEMRGALLDNPNATLADIQEAISNGDFKANDVIKTLHKQKLINDNAMFTAEKYGYDKEKVTTLSDNLLIESLKEKNKGKGNGAGAGTEEIDTAAVTIEPFMTQSIMSPAAIKKIQETKVMLSEQRKQLQIDINQYQKGFAANRDGYTIEQLELKNAQQANLDGQIAELEFQENSLRKIMVANGQKAGVDFEKQYQESLPIIKEQVRKKNLEHFLFSNRFMTRETNSTIDVTDKVKLDEEGRPYIPMPNNQRYTGATLIGIESDLIKQGDKYVIHPSPKTSGVIRTMFDELVDEHGKVTSKVQFSEKNGRHQATMEAGFLSVPTNEEYMDTVIDAYNESTNAENWLGMDKESYKKEGSKAIIDNGTLRAIDSVREKMGDFEWETAQPLSYLLVTGESSKSALRAYVNGEKALNASFKRTPEQFEINTPEGKKGLGLYLSDEYGIPDLSEEYIDWKATNAVTLSDTDREYGQKHGLTIVLTPNGKDELNSKGEKLYTRTNNLKLTAVNPSKNIPAEQAEIQDRLLTAYAEVQSNNTTHGVNMAKEMGKIYLDNSPEGKALDRLNLYTLAAGEIKSWNVRGTEYNIISTTKDATQSDLMNVDFHLTSIENNKHTVLAKDNKTGETIWKNLSEVENSTEYSKVIFNSPSDIKSVVGAKLLDDDYSTRKGKNSNEIGAFQQYLNEAGYSNTGNNQVIDNNYRAIVRDVRNNNKTDQNVTLVNHVSGESVTFSGKVPQGKLVNVADTYPDRIATNNQYPYIHKDAEPYVNSILDDTNVTLTGGFRGNATHFGLKDSSENSLHKYGFATDIRADEDGEKFYQDVTNNPSLLKKYNILSIKKHGDDLHIHVEFNPTSL